MQYSDHQQLVPHRLLAAHLLAIVFRRLFPYATLAGGGTNSIGFYYDFVFESPLTKQIIELIEQNLRQFIQEKHSLRYVSMMRENAQSLFEHQKQFLLSELSGLERENIIELIQIGDYFGLCPPLEILTTDEIGSVKLLDCDELTQNFKNETISVIRILGTTQPTSKELKLFLKDYDSYLKKKDHRLLGLKQNLFSFCHSIGHLGVVWHDKGVILRRLLQDWVEKMYPIKRKHISTPLAGRQNYFFKDDFALNPFEFQSEEYRLRSSPLRAHLDFLLDPSLGQEVCQVTEYAQIYRFLPESQWWGLLNCCTFQSDYTTMRCHKDQLVKELISSLHFIEQIIKIFGFEARWVLIASRQKSFKSHEEIEAIEPLKQAIYASTRLYPFSLEYQEEGEAWLELRIKDKLRREWPSATLKISSNINGLPSSSVILIKQFWSSIDRFIALLIEHYEGKFPLWMAPEQVRVIAIGEENKAYAKEVFQSIEKRGLRVGLDLIQKKLSSRVHEAEKEAIPYIILLGEQERTKKRLTVRGKEFYKSHSVDLETFLNKLYQESLPPCL